MYKNMSITPAAVASAVISTYKILIVLLDEPDIVKTSVASAVGERSLTVALYVL